MKQHYYSYVGIYTFFYASIGTLFPLLGQYLDQIGMTGVQIGVITAAATATGIVASPFWGWKYHHSSNGMRTVLFLYGSSTLIILGLIFIHEYIIFLLCYAVFSFFQAPILPLNDALTLEARAPFGAVRKWGAIGFAFGVFAAGQIADATDLTAIFFLCALGFVLSGITIFRLIRRRETEIGYCPHAFTNSPASHAVSEEEHDRTLTPEMQDISARGDSGSGYWALFQNKKLMALLFSAFFICGTNVANNTYFGFLYKDVGGSIAGIGIAFLLMCGSEAPFMACIERISGIFTLERMILISMGISAGRYLWYSTGPAPELLIGTFFLQGMVNGVILIEFVRYIAKLVEPHMIGMAMTLYQAISSSCSTILCQLIGGAVLEHFGGREVYLFFGVYNLFGILLYVGFGLHKSISKKV